MAPSLNERQSPRRRLPFFFVCAASLLLLGWFAWVPIQCWRIRSLLASSQLDRAASLAAAAVRQFPSCAECQYLHARTLRRQGKFQEATAALNRAAELKWNEQDLFREQVLIQVQLGKTARVRQELDAIFGSELARAETEEVYEALALGHLAAFDIPEFEQCLDFWLKWNPQAAKPRLLRAQHALRLGKHAEAARQFEELLKQHPELTEARQGWGECLLALNRPTEAASQFRRCWQETNEPLVAVFLAKSLVQIGESQEALKLLQQVRQTADPQVRAQVLEQLGRWHLDAGQAEPALEYLKESVELAPEASTAWHSLSAAYSMKGQRELAAQALQVSQETQDRCYRLGVAVKELESKPQSTDLRLEIAQILLKQGMEQDAVAWLNTILQIDRRHPEANRLLAEYFDRHGNSAQAAEHRLDETHPVGGTEASTDSLP